MNDQTNLCIFVAQDLGRRQLSRLQLLLQVVKENKDKDGISLLFSKCWLQCNPTQMSSLLVVVGRGSTGLAAEETLLLGDSMTHSGLTRNLVITYNKIRNSGIKDFQYLFTSMI